MVLLTVALVSLILAARWLTGNALGLRPPLLPRGGAPWRRVLLALAGPSSCLLALWLLAFVVNLVWGLRAPAPPQVESVAVSSPAQESGLQPGDRVLALNGQPLGSVSQLQAGIADSSGQPTLLQVDRGGARSLVTVLPRFDGASYRIGVRLQDTSRFERGLLFPSLGQALLFPLRLAGQLLDGLHATQPSQQVRVELAGPVALRAFTAQQPSIGHGLLYMASPWLLIFGALSLVVSLALLPVRARRAPA